MPEGGNSMFETVTQHGEKISNHDERIGILETAREIDGKRITKLEEQFIIFENTIHTTATETRNVMREQTQNKQKNCMVF